MVQFENSFIPASEEVKKNKIVTLYVQCFRSSALLSYEGSRACQGVMIEKDYFSCQKRPPPPLRAQVFHSKLTEAVSSWLMHEFVFTAAQRGSDAATYWVSYGDTANHSSGLSCSGLSCSAAIPRPTTGGDAATSRCRGSPTWLWVATKAINIKCWVRIP